MLRIGAFAMLVSFVIIFAASFAVYYQIIPIDPTRAIIGGFVICMGLGTLPVWWPWIR